MTLIVVSKSIALPLELKTLDDTSVKPVDVNYISPNRRSYTNSRAGKKTWSLLSVKNIILEIFRRVQLVVLAAEGKTGSGSLIEEVTLMGGGL